MNIMLSYNAKIVQRHPILAEAFSAAKVHPFFIITKDMNNKKAILNRMALNIFC
jgi:hypothetical protein